MPKRTQSRAPVRTPFSLVVSAIRPRVLARAVKHVVLEFALHACAVNDTARQCTCRPLTSYTAPDANVIFPAQFAQPAVLVVRQPEGTAGASRLTRSAHFVIAPPPLVDLHAVSVHAVTVSYPLAVYHFPVPLCQPQCEREANSRSGGRQHDAPYLAPSTNKNAPLPDSGTESAFPSSCEAGSAMVTAFHVRAYAHASTATRQCAPCERPA